LEIVPHEKLPHHFQWAIKEKGKLVRVSGGTFPSKRKALASGMAALDEDFRKAQRSS
jgi:hypothetical protein